MQFVGLIILLVGAYLIDSGIRNRAPIGFIEEIVRDPSDLSGTLNRMNGKWTEPFGPSVVQATNIPIDEGKAQGKEATGLSGYENGKLPSSLLRTKVGIGDGYRLYKPAADSFDALNEAYRKEFGSNIAVTDSYRTFAQQVAVKAAKGNLAATPGTSNHGWGKAVDLGGGINKFGTKQHNWMKANAPKYGWVQPPWAVAGGRKPEPWHWEWAGSTSTDVTQDRTQDGASKSRGGTF